VHAKCRLEAELKAKKEVELRAKAKLERDRLERGQADEIAGAMNEFFTALYHENPSANFDNNGSPDMPSHMTSSFGDLPLSSPDSITVTTEFGVLEEIGNVTIISAGGAAHPYDAVDHDDGYDDELDYQNMEDDAEGPESYVVMTEDTSAVSPDWVTAVALQHQQQQNSWLLQQQMQHMYNVALGVNTTAPPAQSVALALESQGGAGIQEYDDEDEDEDEEDDTGEEADVDTDDVLEVDGTSTPTAMHVETQTQTQTQMQT
jgi:hypothetical protein